MKTQAAAVAAGAGAALRIDDVTVEVAGRRIVEGISLAAHDEVVGLVGPNGSGKSTVLRTVYRMLRPTAGAVTVADRDVWKVGARAAARVTAAVVQDSPSDIQLTVAECVATGRVSHGNAFGADTADGNRAIERAMLAAEVTALAHRDISTLSGGERQRVQLARALAQQPRILVLDEPTNHLDIRHQIELLSMVRNLGITTLTSLHDLNLAAAYCDRIIVLSKGRVVASGTPQDVFGADLLRDVFGVHAAITTNPLNGRTNIVYADHTEERNGTERAS